MSERLGEVARVVRSKNAGPTLLTVDVLFADETGYRRGIAALGPEAVARLYGQPAGRVSVVPCRPALAIKIVMARSCIAGSPGDRDVYGAQQHGPLLAVAL